MSKRTKRTWIEWGEWTCDSCEAKVSGKNKSCPACGNPREKAELDKVSFDKPEVVTKKDELADALAGPDWHCSHCSSGNKGTEVRCVKCGSGRLAQQPAKEANESAAKLAIFGTGLTVFGLPIAAPIALIGVVVLAVSAYGAWWALQTHSTNGVVSSMHWEQRVHRDNWQEVTKEDWQADLYLRPTTFPTNGTGESAGVDNIRNCQSKYHHTRHYVCGSERVCHDATRQVANGESCHDSCHSNGNGSRTCHEVCSTRYKTEHYQKCGMEDKYCDERIYKPWCQYDTWEWHEVDVQRLSGSDNKTKWPEVVPGPLDRLRRDADYRVNVRYTDAGESADTYTEPGNEAEFKTWALGSPAVVSIYNMGAVESVKHPEAKP